MGSPKGGGKIGVFDVPATQLIEEVAKDFSQRVEVPDFAKYVKSGVHRERAPLRADWWHVRLASVLYRIFRDGPVGTESLRTYYGGRKARGRKPHKFAKASGKVIRLCLQVLEKEGLIKKEKKGRGISPNGQAYLTKKANQIRKTFIEERRKLEEKLAAEAKEREGREEQMARAKAARMKELEQRREAEARAAVAGGVEAGEVAGKEETRSRDEGAAKAGEMKEAAEKGKPSKEEKEAAEAAKANALAKKAEEESRKIKEHEEAKAKGKKK